jgi:hypothetical protein
MSAAPPRIPVTPAGNQPRLGDDLVPDDLFAEATPRPSRPRRQRRRWAAGHVLVAILVGFALATLLNAASLKRMAEGLPIGFQRSAAVTLITPVRALSSWLRLDAPRRLVDSALGREPLEHHAIAKPTPHAVVRRLRTPTAAAPLRLWIGGDSMAMVFGQSLVTMAGDTGVIKPQLDYHISTGLSRPDFYDWPYHFTVVMNKTRPEAMVVMFGANDGQDVEYAGQHLHFGSPGWLALYHQRVGSAMDLIQESALRVYWVGQPVMRSAQFSHTVSVLNDVYRQEAAKRPWVRFIPTWSLFADAHGHYTAYLKAPDGSLQLMRNEDGVHLTRAGGDRMATVVLQAIAADWHINL